MNVTLDLRVNNQETNFRPSLADPLPTYLPVDLAVMFTEGFLISVSLRPLRSAQQSRDAGPVSVPGEQGAAGVDERCPCPQGLNKRGEVMAHCDTYRTELYGGVAEWRKPRPIHQPGELTYDLPRNVKPATPTGGTR